MKIIQQRYKERPVKDTLRMVNQPLMEVETRDGGFGVVSALEGR
jgi:hypothetical protein